MGCNTRRNQSLWGTSVFSPVTNDIPEYILISSFPLSSLKVLVCRSQHFEALKWHLQLNCHPHFPLFRSESLQTKKRSATHAQTHTRRLAQTKLMQRKSNNEVQPPKAGVKINIWGIIASVGLCFKWACFAWNPEMSFFSSESVAFANH